ncbi:GIY-YIG nuclease family protein [Imbroritus primus]|uniref:GIY-YIG nuclease family protein n=1 Tax=Imbroritus primus TaxID=3058603 RepID=UPI003D160F5B
MLECAGGSLYTGITTDVARRFSQHQAGKGARYTRSHPPLRIAGAVACGTRSDALKAELAVKRMTAAAKRDYCASLSAIPRQD